MFLTTRLLPVLFFILPMLWQTPGRAEVLYEAYAKVILAGTHVGYVVSRYDFDAKKKQFRSVYLTKTNEAGGSINESLQAVANEQLEPISYQYNSANKNITKKIEATFAKNKMKAKVTINGKTQKLEKTIPSGVFLSNFLAYVMLKSPAGMKTGTKYEYQAIAEEDAELTPGVAFVKETETFKGIKAFRIINEFKGVQFVSLATDKGEALSTAAPAQSVFTEIVADPTQATQGFTVSEKNLKLLFGNVPTGVENTLTKMATASTKVETAPEVVTPPAAGGTPTDVTPAPSATSQHGKGMPVPQYTGVPTKRIGVPGGKGIILKPQAK